MRPGDGGEGDATCSGSIDARIKLTDAPKLVSAAAQRGNAKLPIRCNGRWLKPTLVTSGSFTVMKGLELELGTAGVR